MNKRAYTLVELLAVIAILAVLITIVTINVTSYIEKTRQASFDTLVKSIESSAELFVTEHISEFPELEIVGSTFDIELADLVTEHYVGSNLVDDRSGEPIPLTTKINVSVISKNEIAVEFDYQ